MPGFSRPGGPKRTSFMGRSFLDEREGWLPRGRRIMRRERAWDQATQTGAGSPGRISTRRRPRRWCLLWSMPAMSRSGPNCCRSATRVNYRGFQPRYAAFTFAIARNSEQDSSNTCTCAASCIRHRLGGYKSAPVLRGVPGISKVRGGCDEAGVCRPCSLWASHDPISIKTRPETRRRRSAGSGR